MKRKLSLQDTGRSTGNCLFRDGKMQTVFCEMSEIGRLFCTVERETVKSICKSIDESV